MSKYVKNLITENLRERLKNVNDALLVNMIGLSANANNRLRGELAGKNVNVIVVKNSLAARATAGTPLEPMFQGLSGTSAICWGSEDIVSLAKEIARLVRDEKNKPFEARAGVMDGQRHLGRRGRSSSYLAQPLGTTVDPHGANPQPGRKLGQPIDQRGRGPGQPDRTKKRRRRRSRRRSEGRKLNEFSPGACAGCT